MFPLDSVLQTRSEQIIQRLHTKKWTLAVAESCTGGLITSCLTHHPGASSVLDRGFVTYSNAAKIEDLGVHPDTIAQTGAVSPETAREMAYQVRKCGDCDIGLSVTGIAGPGGGTPAKPVGLVYFGICLRDRPASSHKMCYESADRQTIRFQSVLTAFDLIMDHTAN